MDLTEGYAFLIHTDKYAGNFERELCAWVTGCVGDCGVGDIELDFNYEEVFDDDIIQYCSNNHGVDRPCEIYRHDGEYNSVAIYFYDKPIEKVIETIKERSIKFCKNHKDWQNKPDPIKIKDFGMIKVTRTIIQIEL